MYKAQAQTPEVNATEISKIFTERTQNFVFYIYDLVEQVINSGQSEKILHELETKANTHHLRARLYVLKAAVLYYQEAKRVNN